MNNPPALVERNMCTGCAACANICNQNAISMEEDKTGFLFPNIDYSRCISCNRCVKVCPALQPLRGESIEPAAYIGQNKDDSIRLESTSGGVFSAIASEIISLGGVVFGAAMKDNFSVAHILIESEKDLSFFRNSKYVQSEIGNTFCQTKRILDTNRLVCFSGTPCQIQGLKKYLGREYDNLYTVDFMCRAVPSPKVFQKYVLGQREKYADLKRIVFRDKAWGYSYSTLSIYDTRNQKLYRGGSEFDQWLRIFFKGYCNRESCYNCRFQSGIRVSDFTLWDCWGTRNYAPEMDDNKGTTNVIVWSEKGKRLFENIREKKLRIKELGIESIDASLERNVLSKPDFDAEVFWNDVNELPADRFFNKYVPISAKIRIKSSIRRMIYKLHLHDTVRRVVHKFRKAMKG